MLKILKTQVLVNWIKSSILNQVFSLRKWPKDLKRGLTGSLYLVKPVQILYHLAILMSARPLRVNHMKPKPFFTDQAVGLVLKRRIKATPQESSDAAQRRSHALSEDLENKMDRWNKMDERRCNQYLSSKHRCLYPASLSFYISHISPTHWELL